ncbi:MAG: heme biosynthesis protein HemY, partial [Hyphomicrobiales bacterium]|nr:heme biosynthesis protein HemY [Hyphomicrobiales bacterium]
MIRLLIYIAVVLLLGFGFAWLADRPGDLVVTWQGQRIEMSLMVAATAVVALVAVIMFGWWLIRSIAASPHTVSRFFRARKRDRGYQALSTGLIAAGAGDAATARKMTQRTLGLLSSDQEPLIHLLDAQTALIEGKDAEARAKFEAMVEDPETRELGLRGLYLEARKLGAMEAAQHYAEEAAEKAPHLPWAADATLGFKSADGAWDDAIRLLEKQRMARVIDKADADRKKAVLLTARAMDKLELGDVAGARTDGVEANRLAGDLVPAALIAAQALYRENSLRKGSRILEKIWKAEPNPEIAEAYVRARSGDSTHDRLKRAQKLESFKRNNVESLYAVARAALDAQEFALAHEKAEAAIRVQAREGVYLLLADIEEADTGDQGRVRHWLSQAVRAQRDPAWTADGYVAEHWAPVSSVTGKLDAFEWKVPVEQIAGRVEDASTAHDDAEQAIKSLPPVV